ncbi:MAG: LD-carboxypeptidase [Candidatus Acidiferrales bacterium]
MPQSLKPEPLRPGDAVRILSLSSPVKEIRLQQGLQEIVRLGYTAKFDPERVLASGDFFAGSAAERGAALREALTENTSRGIFCSRGGYGSNYLLEGLSVALATPKILMGYSDLTSLQIFLWQKFRWVTLYGPMVAAGLDKGAEAAEGYDLASLAHAVADTKQGWTIELSGTEAIMPGSADGILLGGCLTLIETALGTPWELDTHGSILVLEDRGMKPWQVDRALMHLKQAGKLRGVSGVVLGDFPECEAPAGSETVRDVARRILGTMGFPVVWGAPVGHTARAMLTLPLGVRARLRADESSRIEILEPACRG